MARSPQDVMYDDRVTQLLGDLDDTCASSMYEANKLARKAIFKHFDASAKSSLTTAIATLKKTMAATAVEFDRCYDGKAKDLNKFKACLSKELDALDNLEEIQGRMHVLEDKALDVVLAAFLVPVASISGANGELSALLRRMNALSAKLQKAIKTVRDVKIKGAVSAALAGIGLCAGSLGSAVVITVGVSSFAINQGLSMTLNGNEPNDVKKTMTAAKGGSTVAKALGKFPKAFGPVLNLASGVVDIREVFISEQAMADVQKEIKALDKEFKKLLPRVAKQFDDLEKLALSTEKALSAALSGVKAFSPTKGKVHTLPNLMR